MTNAIRILAFLRDFGPSGSTFSRNAKQMLVTVRRRAPLRVVDYSRDDGLIRDSAVERNSRGPPLALSPLRN
jgi:hypothetical protein